MAPWRCCWLDLIGKVSDMNNLVLTCILSVIHCDIVTDRSWSVLWNDRPGKGAVVKARKIEFKFKPCLTMGTAVLLRFRWNRHGRPMRECGRLSALGCEILRSRQEGVCSLLGYWVLQQRISEDDPT